jgi:hypothetical protein
VSKAQSPVLFNAKDLPIVQISLLHSIVGVKRGHDEYIGSIWCTVSLVWPLRLRLVEAADCAVSSPLTYPLPDLFVMDYGTISAVSGPIVLDIRNIDCDGHVMITGSR